MHLWNHVSPPPVQNSILIYKDGTVREGNNFAPWEITDSNVYLFILGGTDWRCEGDDFARDALLAAGYTCGFGVDLDVYSGDDTYTDDYPLEASP